METKAVAALAALAIIGLAAGCGPAQAPHNPRLDVEAADADAGAGTAPFTAVASGDVGEVCAGRAMTNAAPLDPGAPVGLAFSTWDGEERRDVDALFLERPWVLAFDDFAATSVVACARVAEPLDADAALPCEASGFEFAVAPSVWAVELREAATGDVLATGPSALPGVAPECPEVAPLHVEDVVPADPDAVAIGDAADVLVTSL